MAFVSNDAGTMQVFMAATDGAESKVQVSTPEERYEVCVRDDT